MAIFYENKSKTNNHQLVHKIGRIVFDESYDIMIHHYDITINIQTYGKLEI